MYMRNFIYIALIIMCIFSCTSKRELLVPVLLNYDLYYPDEAREQGLEGAVMVRVFIDESGKAKDVIISKSSENCLLDSAAVRTAKTFTFSPAMRGNNAIQTWVQVPIEFRLKMVHPEFWLTEVKILQNMIKNQYNKEWVNDLYDLYKQMIYLPREGNEAESNYYILHAVLDETAKVWEGYWQVFPANILLFIDVINRYPESFTSLEAKADFNNFMKKEVPRIKNTLSPQKSDSLISRLQNAVEE
jgi:TonB family protein